MTVRAGSSGVLTMASRARGLVAGTVLQVEDDDIGCGRSLLEPFRAVGRAEDPRRADIVEVALGLLRFLAHHGLSRRGRHDVTVLVAAGVREA